MAAQQQSFRNEQEVLQAYQAMREELTGLVGKANELEAELGEHRLVIKVGPRRPRRRPRRAAPGPPAPPPPARAADAGRARPRARSLGSLKARGRAC